MEAFWIGIIVMVVIVVGVSVLAGKALSRPRRPAQGDRHHQQMMGLKASGALRHRKSNRD